MDVEIPVLAGVLTIPTQTGFSLNRISKKVRFFSVSQIDKNLQYEQYPSTTTHSSISVSISTNISTGYIRSDDVLSLENDIFDFIVLNDFVYGFALSSFFSYLSVFWKYKKQNRIQVSVSYLFHLCAKFLVNELFLVQGFEYNISYCLFVFC